MYISGSCRGVAVTILEPGNVGVIVATGIEKIRQVSLDLVILVWYSNICFYLLTRVCSTLTCHACLLLSVTVSLVS